MKSISTFKKLLLTIAMIFSVCSSVFASHGMGADITYDYISANNYRVKLKFFRDCHGIVPGTTSVINIKSAIGGFNQDYTLTQVGSPLDITPLCSSQASFCTNPSSTNDGVQQYTYEATINLPIARPDYILSFSLCCRNIAITTLSDPGNQNIYVETLLNSQIANSSPDFNNTPVPFSCNGQLINYSHGVFDVDGDELVFSLVPCLQGAGAPVTYAAGFSGAQPLTATAALSINTATGALAFTPNAIQVAVIAVKVDEYRLVGGIRTKIGETRRDMQFTIDDCSPANNSAPIVSGINGTAGSGGTTGSYTIAATSGTPVSFNLAAYDANTPNLILTWNNGIAGGTFTPNGTGTAASFSWTPTINDGGTNFFTVTVKDDNCPLLGISTYTFNVQVTVPLTVTCPSNQTANTVSGACSAVVSYISSATGSPAPTITYVFSGATTGSGNGDGSGSSFNAGVTTVTLTATDGTSTTNCSFTVTVTVTLTSAAGTNAQTVCTNTPIDNITYAPTGATGASFAGLPAGVTGSFVSDVVTISGTPSASGTFNYTVTFTGACGNITATGTIVVNPTPNAIATPSAQTICTGATITTIALTSTTTGTVYNWTRDNAGVTGIAASGAGDISGTLTNTTNAPVTVTFTITPTANGCAGTAITATVTVNPTPDVNQPANQVVCNGAPTAPVTFTGTVAGAVFNWTNSTPSIGLAAAGSGDIPSFSAVNTGNAPVVATINVTPIAPTNAVSYTIYRTHAGNGSTTQYGSYADNAADFGNLFNVANSNTTILGTGTTTAQPIMNFTNAGQLISAGIPAPGSGDFFGINITSTFTAAETGIYTFGIDGDDGVDLSINGNVVTSFYGPHGFGGYQIGTIALVAGQTYTLRVRMQDYSGGEGLAVVWQRPSQSTMTLQGSELSISSCSGPSKTFTYTVNPTPNATATPSTQTICSGATITTIAITGTVSGTVYNWTRDNAGVTGIAGSGTGNISGSLTNTTTAPVTVTFTITPSYTNAGVTCSGTPITATVVVNPTPTVNAVANQVVCNNSPTTAVTFTSPTNGGTIVYNWTNTTTSIGLAASGTGNITSFTATNTTTAPVTATITVTPSYTNGGVTCVGTPITYTYTVNPTATVTAVTSQVICNGSPTTAVNFTSPTTGGTIVYNWTNNTTSIGLAASGTGNIASFTATNTTTAPVTATITVTPSYTNGGVTCVGTPITYTYTVNPTATVNAVANQVVCNNSPTTAVTFSSPTTGGSIVYNWTNNTTSIGLAASGTGNIASFTATNTTTAPVVATITVTPSYTNAGVTCVGTPRTYTYTVNPTATVTAVTSQVICNGSPTTVVNFTSPTTGGTIVYNWTNNTTSIGLAASGTGNIASFTATNTTTAPVTATMTVTPSYTNGGVTCVGTPITYTYTVNPTATVTPVTSQVICNGSPTTAVTFSSPTTGGTIVYNWTNNTASIGLAASGTGNIASFTAVNTGTAPAIATITVTPSYTNAGVTCVGTPITYTYTVNPTATVNVVANQVVCNLSPTTAVTFTSPTTGGTIVYNWTNTTTSIGLDASGTGNITSFTATNATTAPVTATITVTPSYTNAGVTCVGTPRTFTITVNPTATVNPVANQVLCNNFPTTAVTFTSPTTGGTIVYNWTNNTTSIGLAATGTGNIASFTATNTTQVPVVATITVTPSYTNAGVTCVGTPLTFTITVNPTPIVTLAPFAAICKNAAPITLTGGSPVAGTGTTGVYLVDNVAQTIFNPANYTPGLHTIVYVYTNVFGCVNSATQTILVHPIHAVEITVTPNRAVSPNSPLTVVATVSPVDNYTYVWRKNGTVVSGANGDRITVLANDAGNYTVTVTAPTGCVVVSSSAFTPSASVPQTLFIFPNPNTGVFNVAYNNGGANLTARTLMVYDSKGARVFSQSYSVNVPFGNMKVDISKYAKGLYYVVLTDSNGKKLASASVEKL